MGALNESLFVTTADALLAKGLLTAGYHHVHLDDAWSLPGLPRRQRLPWRGTRPSSPGGLPWLADFLKARGFTHPGHLHRRRARAAARGTPARGGPRAARRRDLRGLGLRVPEAGRVRRAAPPPLADEATYRGA